MKRSLPLALAVPLSLVAASGLFSAPCRADEPVRDTVSAGDEAPTVTTPEVASPAPEGSAPAASAPPSNEQAPAEPTVFLHVESTRVVAIERADTGEFVCASPCDVDVSATARYRVAGARGSRPFVLDARKPTAALRVDAATHRGFLTGVLGASVGGALLAAGGITLGVATANRDPIPPDGVVTHTGFTDAVALGTALVIAGVATGVWGTATVISNGSSKVSGDIVKDPPARGRAVPPTHRADFAPAPAARLSPSVSSTVLIPILGGTF